MASLASERPTVRAVDVTLTEDELSVALEDGREGVGVETLLAGRRSGERQASPKRWLEERSPTRRNKRMQPTARRARRG